MQLLDHVTDIIAFGAIIKCVKCTTGNFVLANSTYVCSDCKFEMCEPPRMAARVFSEMKHTVEPRALILTPTQLQKMKQEQNNIKTTFKPCDKVTTISVTRSIAEFFERHIWAIFVQTFNFEQLFNIQFIVGMCCVLIVC